MGGLQTNLDINRDTAMQLGLTLSAIDNTLYDAFGQRQVYDIQCPQPVSRRHGGRAAILAGSADAEPDLCLEVGVNRPACNSIDSRPAITRPRPEPRARRRHPQPISWRAISRPTRLPQAATRPPRPALRSRPRSRRWFRSRPSPSRGGATRRSGSTIRASSRRRRSRSTSRPASRSATQDQAIADAHQPLSACRLRFSGRFAGTASSSSSRSGTVPVLFTAALVTIYLVLGILYESLIHPLTILSTR